MDLPTYAFQREHYWLDAAPALAGRPADPSGLESVVRSAHDDSAHLTGTIGLRSHPWLADHRVLDAAVLPGTALLDWAVRAGDETGCAVVAEFTEHLPLTLPEDGTAEVQVAVGAPDGASGLRPVTVYTRTDGDGPWTRNATGTLGAAAADPDVPDVTWSDTWPPAGATPVDPEPLHQRLAEHGHGHGPLFDTVRALWQRDGETFAEVALAPATPAAGFRVHPALLQTLLTLGTAGTVPALPYAWRGVRVLATGRDALRVRLPTPRTAPSR